MCRACKAGETDLSNPPRLSVNRAGRQKLLSYRRTSPEFLLSTETLSTETLGDEPTVRPKRLGPPILQTILWALDALYSSGGALNSRNL